MLTEVETGIVVSTEGYKIIARGRKVVYIERDRVAEFVADPGGPTKWLILLGRVQWNGPYDQEVISSDRRTQIQQRVVEALQFMNAFCEFDFEH